MDVYSERTRYRVKNGWLEINRINGMTNSYTYTKLDTISHVTREGPYGDYYNNGEPFYSWVVIINTSRYVAGKKVNHTINFWFRDESQAESFVTGLNNKIY